MFHLINIKLSFQYISCLIGKGNQKNKQLQNQLPVYISKQKKKLNTKQNQLNIFFTHDLQDSFITKLS